MNDRDTQPIESCQVMKRILLSALTLGLLFCTPLVQCQVVAQNQFSVSELERRNMSLVGATSAEIKQVLLSNPGLMVEVKRWVAKNASDHGQIITTADLSESAIYERLENDAEFRSAVTLILQGYGYLLPQVEPGSPAAKEQDLLVQERVKWIQQAEEQQRMRNMQQFQAAGDCANQANGKCSSSSPSQAPGPAKAQLPIARAPEQEDTPQIPSGPAIQQLLQNPSLLQAALTQLDGAGGGLSALGLSSGNQLLKTAFNGGGTSLSNPLLSSLGADQISDLLSGLSAGGASGSYSPDDSGILGMASSVPLLDSISPAHPSGTPVVAGTQSNAGLQGSAGESLHKMVRISSPYSDVPSLYDMYLQAAPPSAEPKRFGSDVFENGSRDPGLIPTDMPAGPGYIVGSGDGLTIDLWGGVSQRLQRTVDREGRISLPDAGPVLVSGKSLSQIQTDLQQTLRHVFRDESVDVSLSRLKTIRIYEVGDVQSPGAYDISSLSTPLNALFAAGGPTEQGSLRIVKHYRGDRLVQEVDLYNLLLKGVKSGLESLENGDTVLVPPAGPQVTIEGMVRRPAIYELAGEKSLSSVLSLAGGLLPAATLRHVEVQRLIAHEKRTMLSLDIPQTDSDAIQEKLDAFQVQDGDRIRIFPIAPYNEDVVYLEGHVMRPGRYSYTSDMRVSDLIASYKDLLPEPATQYAEIIRLNPPDFHPSVESFNVADALANPASSPVLKPLDTVRVFGRFDFQDRPSVSIVGDVRTPGTYPTTGQVHLVDAVHLGGGLSADAARNDAQVFRYEQDGTVKIFGVNLQEALTGDPSANIALQSRDRLLIHRNPEAAQPANVFLRGDVVNPGRFPLATNMTIADLIRAGGGLTPSANKESADLTRYSYSPNGKLEVQHETLSISAALSGDPASNVSIHNGDVLTIRELPGWSDVGASITLKGEVNNQGTYGIRPGERLSSVIDRAGGFATNAYVYGAILQRVQVRELEAKQQDELITRVREQQTQIELLPEIDLKAKVAKQTAVLQFQHTIDELAANPPLGRVAIRISNQIARWKDTSADIELRNGDTLTIPNRPGYVMVTGQVYDAMAVSYRPERSAKWYLSQSGGPTALANKRGIFVVRADGSIISGKTSLLTGDSLDAPLQPGDTIVVPERALGGGPNWQVLLTAAQVTTSVASTVFIALHY
ncbi:MAG: SLBB domain-containing protein [Candidatus Acidiferrales bacterium]